MRNVYQNSIYHSPSNALPNDAPFSSDLQKYDKCRRHFAKGAQKGTSCQYRVKVQKLSSTDKHSLLKAMTAGPLKEGCS